MKDTFVGGHLIGTITKCTSLALENALIIQQGRGLYSLGSNWSMTKFMSGLSHGCISQCNAKDLSPDSQESISSQEERARGLGLFVPCSLDHIPFSSGDCLAAMAHLALRCCQISASLPPSSE